MKRALPLLAALCAALGAALLIVPGLRFSALLLFCMAAFLAVLAGLGRIAEEKRWAVTARRALLIAFCAGCVLFLALEGMILSGSRGDADDAPVSCVVILGAGVDGTEPSLMLWSRLDAALRYLADKPDIPVIVSGSKDAGAEISEAECMYRWLIARGVEESRVWKEEQATSTRTNFERAYDLMAARGVDPSGSFAFVTNDFHIFRARMLSAAPQARGVAATLPRCLYYDTLTANYFVREAFALANEFLLRMDLDL